MFRRVENTTDEKVLKLQLIDNDEEVEQLKAEIKTEKRKAKSKPKAKKLKEESPPDPKAPFSTRSLTHAVVRLHYLSGRLSAGPSTPLTQLEIMQIMDWLLGNKLVTTDEHRSLSLSQTS